MYLALYRKYRSRSLDQIIGQPQVTIPLQNAINNHQISHAYLFIGPRGTGKTSVARILAHAVNDFTYEIEDQHLDIIEIDAASNTGVDNIRELREKALVAPSFGKYKVYIIDEVHMLSKSAFNALLKTLEEPPTHVIFIMATTDAHKVPITITSRSQCYQFKLADPETLQNHLKTIATAEHIDITDAALTIIAKRGNGSFRDAISLLDQIITIPDRPITDQIIISMLGLPSDETIHALISAYQSQDISHINHTVSSLVASGLHPETIAEELIAQILRAPEPSSLPLLSDLIDVARSPFPIAKLLLALAAPLNRATTIAAAPSSPVATTPSLPTPSLAVTAARAKFMNHLKSPASTISTVSPPPAAPSNSFVQPTIQAPVTAATFDWDTFIRNVKFSSSIIAAQLTRTTHHLDGTTLYITPTTKVAKNILETPKNREIIIKYLGELTLVIADPTQPTTTPSSSAPSAFAPDPTQAASAPQAVPTSAPFDQISAIMGTAKEVNINHDDIPV